jgi:hypothetical protein
MIKKGDELICIKTITHFATGAIRFNEGKYYEVMDNIDGEIWLIPEDEDRKCYIGGDRTDRFLTLAEWRDKQINSILEDET